MKDEAREAARESAYRERICRAESDEALAFGMFDAGCEFANKWHVIERDGLPTKNRMYLVSLKGGEVAMAWLDDDGHWGISYNEPYKLDEGDVVAYRERPMPYKGE